MASGSKPSRGRRGRFERTIEQARRDAEAATLRVQGWTYRAIAEQLGYSGPQIAYDAVQRALLHTVAEPASELRVVEAERLDEALRVAFRILHTDRWISVYDPEAEGYVPQVDDRPKLLAIREIVRIAERRAKLLGLDAPTQIHVLSADVIDAEIARLAAELGVQPGAVAAIEAAPAPLVAEVEG